MTSSAPFLFLVLLLVGLVFLAAVLWLKFSPRETRADGDLIYQAWKTILTPSERSFAGALEQALPEGVRLLVKVRLGDVFFTRKELHGSLRTRARNRINQKHVDFLLVRTSDFAPLAGFELDDQSHHAKDRQRRDRFVDQVFASCHLPLFHIPAAASYNAAELRSQVAGLLASAPPASPPRIL